VLVSSVRGSEVPLYMAGARLVAQLPISIVIDGIGLNCTGFSYAGTLWICALSCREMLPDPAFFAACLRESFEDLKRGAAVHAERAAPPAATAAAPAARAAPAPKTRKRPRAAAATTRRRKVNGTAARHLS
jgi:diacylglycerol O-acyltransferase